MRTAENMTKEFDSYMVKFLGTYEGEDDEETGLFDGDKVFVYNLAVNRQSQRLLQINRIKSHTAREHHCARINGRIPMEKI